MTLSIEIDDVLVAMLAMGMASFSNDLVMPPAWGACMDVGGNYAGSLAGSMNMMGNLGGATAPVLGGAVVRYMKGIEAAASSGVAAPRLSASILVWAGSSWNVFLYIMAIVYAVGALCWPFIHPVEGEIEAS
ncbi:MAG: MFS transporter [bacterium]|nr:MFS transporter [bacterium]